MNAKHWFALLALVLCCDKPVEATSPPQPAPPEPKCIRERRMHVYGTYRLSVYMRADQDLPVDLTVTECLEWEKPSVSSPSATTEKK